mmetsp:Transcript_4184/g.14755  ORF Transcript_4184/g.14755 Transcript_4184/m.14755 type:complete len:228 (-) Transcript_4184:1403-2086(-)
MGGRSTIWFWWRSSTVSSARLVSISLQLGSCEIWFCPARMMRSFVAVSRPAVVSILFRLMSSSSRLGMARPSSGGRNSMQLSLRKRYVSETQQQRVAGKISSLLRCKSRCSREAISIPKLSPSWLMSLLLAFRQRSCGSSGRSSLVMLFREMSRRRSDRGSFLGLSPDEREVSLLLDRKRYSSFRRAPRPSGSSTRLQRARLKEVRLRSLANDESHIRRMPALALGA